MKVPSEDNPVWKDLLTGKRECDFSFLAANIFLFRARMELRTEPDALPRLIEEMHDLFARNETLPSVQNDLNKLS